MTSVRISIGKRLSLLVLSELFTAALVVVAGFVALVRLAEQNRYMHEYVFAPLVDIDQATVEAEELQRVAQQPGSAARAVDVVRRLRSFVERYEWEWQVAGSSQPDAARFRAILERAGRLALVDDQREAVQAFLASLKHLGARNRAQRRTDSVAERRGERRGEPTPPPSSGLDRVNLRYMQIGYDDFTSRDPPALTASSFVALGLVGILTAGAAPRPLRPSRHRPPPPPHPGGGEGQALPASSASSASRSGAWEGDELAVLARALDVSFAANAARDQERERFLAVAAHELKTPLTTVKGYAQAALAHRDDRALRDRALTVIDRQATRLARLVEDLLWSACAGAGQLSFQPAPVDLAECAPAL